MSKEFDYIVPTTVYKGNDWYEDGCIYDDDGQGAEIYSLFGGNGDWYLCLRYIDMMGQFHNGSFRISLSGSQLRPDVKEKLLELCKLVYKDSNKSEHETIYELGDLYYEGSKAVGIVVDIKDGGKHATVMSLTSFDKNGEHKTTEQRLEWKDAINGANKYGYGWYLPSKEELKTMYESFDKIQSVLKHTNGALALSDDYYYWSSSEYDSEFAYLLGTYDGDVSFYGNDYRYYVRAFLVV